MGHIFSGAAMLVLLVAIVIPVAFWFGLAASIMWGWFIVPAFGAPSLSTVQCAAIILTLGAFHPKLNMRKADPEEFWSGLGSLVLVPPITVAIGWAIKHWFM